LVRCKAQRLGFRLPHLAERAQGGLKGGQPGADNETEPGDPSSHRVKAHAALGGLFSFGDVTGQTLLDLGETSAEKGSPFLDSGCAHLEVPAQCGHGARALSQTVAGGAFCQSALALLGGLSLELRQQRQKLGGALEVPNAPGINLRLLGDQGFSLSGGFSEIGAGPAQGLVCGLKRRGSFGRRPVHLRGGGPSLFQGSLALGFS
jgi:hypothetical protein